MILELAGALRGAGCESPTLGERCCRGRSCTEEIIAGLRGGDEVLASGAGDAETGVVAFGDDLSVTAIGVLSDDVDGE